MNKETQILTRWVDPTIDDFKIALEEANKQIEEDNKEIERLNNIINEIKKLDLYISEEDYDYEENPIDKYVPIDIEDYIKELGDSSND